MVENIDNLISRQAAIDAVDESRRLNHHEDGKEACAHEYEHRHFLKILRDLPTVEPKTGKWIIDRSGAYCCSKCMEPCATYVMMKPRDKFCKMCGSRNEVTE